MGSVDSRALDRVASRVRSLAADYRPPSFAHIPDPDAALFLCAVDHRTGYRGRYLVDGRGPFEGSALLWEVGLRAVRRRPALLTAARMREITPAEVEDVFRIGGETVVDPDRRAALWRDLAAGIERDHGGSASVLLAAAEGRLGGGGGLLARLARYGAYADPLAKKSFLLAKVCERRGWFEIGDPDHWEVSADNVLMRLALRSGLVEVDERESVRRATRDAFRRVAARARVAVPVLDDLLWELGREDPDLLGRQAGALDEPERDPDLAWY